MRFFAAPKTILRQITARAAGESGLTLIEVLVTALIVGLIASGTAVALVSATHAAGDQQYRSQANTLAAQDQERLRDLSDEQLANLGSSGTTRTVQVNGTSFQVTSTAAFQDAQGNSSCSSTAVDYYKTTSKVTWTEGFHASTAQTQSVTVESLLSRPVSGNLATSITDQTGAGVPGVTVTATPPNGTSGQSAETAVSDTSGCAVMTGLTPATYALSIVNPGWVDFSDMSPTAKNATVGISGTPTTVSAVLGQAGTINTSFTTNSGVGGEANAISFLGAGNTLSSPATLTSPSSPGTAPLQSFTATNLFPFNGSYGTGSPSYANNWTVYAGSCSYQAPPTGSLTKYTVAPGQATSTATGLPSTAPSGAVGIQEPMIKLPTIQGKVPSTATTIKSVQPTDIVLTYTNGTCKDQYEATIAPPASGTGVGATAPTGTGGWLANPGQPYAPAGDLTICADYAYVSGSTTTWYTGTTTAFGNTSWTTPTTASAITLTSGSRCPGAS
jgi:prepilin-type N-terminal cleavage/methylation domain-containing protein